MNAQVPHHNRSVPLVLSELKKEPGPVVLHWFGELQKARSRSQRYTIKAHFRHVESDAEPINIDVPLEAMHLLATGTVWRYGMVTGYHDVIGKSKVKTGNVTLDLPTLEPKAAHRAQLPERSLLPDFAYPLDGIADPAFVRVMPTVAGPDVIFPLAEILRTWYLFHPDMLPVILGDGINHPRGMSRADLPWDPDETRRSGEGAHVVYRTRFGDPSMKRLARLLFDPFARFRAGQLARMFRDLSREPSFPLPFSLPPLEGRPTLTVRYVDVAPWENRRPARRLILSVLGIDHPPPFRELTWAPLHDNRKDPEGSPDRPVLDPFSDPLILSDDEGVQLAGDGRDPSLERARTFMLGFEDNAYYVPTELVPRKPSSHQAGGKPNDPVIVSTTGPDTGAAAEVGVAELAGGDALPSTEAAQYGPPVAFLRMRAVFDRVIDYLADALPGWEVGYLSLAGTDNGVLEIPHEERDDYRFLILHVRGEGRHLYALHGAPIGDDHGRSHQIFACRQPSFRAFTESDFSRWLSGFPYKGRSVWVDKEPGGLKLIPEARNHQPRMTPFDESEWTHAFASNIADAVLVLAY